MLNSHTNLLFCSFTWLLFAYSLFYIVAWQTIKLCTLHHLSIRFNICVQKPGLSITVYSALLLSLKYWFGCPLLGPFRCLQLAFKAPYNQKQVNCSNFKLVEEVFLPHRSWTLNSSLCTHQQIADQHNCRPRIPRAQCPCGLSHRLLLSAVHGVNPFWRYFHVPCRPDHQWLLGLSILHRWR